MSIMIIILIMELISKVYKSLRQSNAIERCGLGTVELNNHGVRGPCSCVSCEQPAEVCRLLESCVEI